VVRVGQDRYGFDRGQTAGSLSGEAVEPLRRAPNGVSGLIDTGSGRIPVVDLHWRLGHPTPIRTSACVVVLLTRIEAGLLVTSVEGIERADLAPAALMLAFGRYGYVRAILPLESGPLPLLEPLALVSPTIVRASVS
jgi:chemotaxis signal transduction protein